MATETTETKHYSDDELCFDIFADNFTPEAKPTASEMSKAGPWGINFSHTADAERCNKRLDRKPRKSRSKVANRVISQAELDRAAGK